MFNTIKRARQDEGFTLIELLIVIVILGILAAVVVFAVGGITDQGERSACRADLKTVEVAAEAYRADRSEYPANLAGLRPDFLRETAAELADGELNRTDGGYAIVYTPGATVNDPPAIAAELTDGTPGCPA